MLEAKKNRYIFLILFLLAFTLTNVAVADVVIRSSRGNSAFILSEIKENDFVFVPLEEFLKKAGGFRFKKGNTYLDVFYKGHKIKFLLNAAVAFFDSTIYPLKHEVFKRNGYFWIEIKSFVNVFNRLYSISGDNIKLVYSFVKQKQVSLIQDKIVDQDSINIRHLRWSINKDHIRIVLDIKGDSGRYVGRFYKKTNTLKLFFKKKLFISVLAKDDILELKGESFIKDVRFSNVKTGSVFSLSFSDDFKIEKFSCFALEQPARIVIDIFPKIYYYAESVKRGSKASRVLKQKNITIKRNLSSQPVVVIDPGHGGKDPGCVGRYGIMEKNINLAVAKKVASYLSKKGVKVILTRYADVYIPLSKRAEIANSRRAWLFVSLHCNALPRGRQAKGLEVYVMSLPSDKDAMRLALIENRELGNGTNSQRKTGLLLKILGDMQQNAKVAESTKAAELIYKVIRRYGIFAKKVAQAPFYVLRGATMPAVLIEMGYLTNPYEAKLLSNSRYQTKIAVAIGEAIYQCLKAISREWR